MSFSSQIKDALTKRKLHGEAEYMPMLAATTVAIGTMVLRRGKGIGVRYTTETHQVAKLILRAVSKLYRVEAELSVHETDSGKGARTSVLTLFGTDVEKLLMDSGLLTDENYTPPTFNEHQKRIFLRGAFLACGSVTDPNKSYHLEIACRNETATDMVTACARELGVMMKYTKRKDNYIVYLKDSDSISMFLSIIGADDAVLELENVRAYRDTRNYANRTTNCDIANLGKTTATAARQIAEIEFLLANYDGKLADHLYETAMARLKNPEASLADLAEILSVGKSGVNHRLQKLIQMAEELQVEMDKGGSEDQ